MSNRNVAIRVRNLVVGFDSTPVLNQLDLDVYKGEILGVVGGSGTGKSVLLRAILGLIRPWQAEIEISGHNPLSLAANEQKECRREWGVLFQDGALFSSLNVAQNIQVPIRENFKLPKVVLDEIALLKIGFVGLEPDVAWKFPADLSGGMRKRAGLARALALDPKLLFLDEPTAGLDPIGAAGFDSLIRSLRDALDLTVFLVTHDLDTLFSVCDRVAVLWEGKILIARDLKTVRRFDHPWVREYFNGPRARAAAGAAGA